MNQHPSARRPTPSFNLVILEALDDWRQALRTRVEWKVKLDHARTPHERATAIASYDRWGMLAMRAEKRLRDALDAEVRT